MADRKEVCRRIKVTDNVNIVKLGVLDQLRLLASRAGNSDEAELDARQKITVEKMRKIAALNYLFNTAIEKMLERGNSSVTLKVSSEFLPYIDEVIDTKRGMGRYYNFRVYKRDLPLTVRHTFVVKISTRVS